jgi:hypothetical protein
MAQLRKTTILSAVVATLFVSTVAAQPVPPPPPGGSYNVPPPPAGGSYNMPPPPGMQPDDFSAENSTAARAQDDQYSYAAEQWAAQNCIAQRAQNTAAGAVIGGLLGALAGGGLAGRHDRGAGIVAGGAVGAIAGAAIGSASTSPGCPPGYGLRPGAAAFYPPAVFGGVVYAAPPSYDPWIWYGGHWIYRPYPYHRYWYRTHRHR